MLTTDMPEWLTVLLTEASAAVHGRGNLNALTAAIREVPEPYLEFAGLRWALSSFDDRAPTAEAINAARDQIGDPAPRLSLMPRSENPHELATAACRCDGRYDGCEHDRRCPNPGGSSHSPYFCTDCDPRRRAHITRNLERIADEHIRSGT